MIDVYVNHSILKTRTRGVIRVRCHPAGAARPVSAQAHIGPGPYQSWDETSMPETTSVSRSGAFRAVGPAGFLDQIRVPRYAERTDLFDEIIAETHRHFWDPLDTAYIRFDEPFDMATETVMPASIVPELNSAVADRLTAQQRVWFANESARWWLSSVLHGEQGALSLSASLCHMLADPGVVEYAANQAREEARHVTAFSRYIHTRWGAPMPASTTRRSLRSSISPAARSTSRRGTMARASRCPCGWGTVDGFLGKRVPPPPPAAAGRLTLNT